MEPNMNTHDTDIPTTCHFGDWSGETCRPASAADLTPTPYRRRCRHGTHMQNLLKALVAATAEISNPRKDSKNPHFRNTYASLESVLDAVVAPLQRHGLVLVQTTEPADADLLLRTTLWHVSGESLTSTALLQPVKRDPQGFAAAATYYRRMQIKALLGLAETDDDGEHATRGTPMPAVNRAEEALEHMREVEDLRRRMEAAESIEQLQVVAAEAQGLPADAKREMRALYMQRRAQLTTQEVSQ